MSTIEKRDEAIDLARYKQAADEIETGKKDDALWYKAFAEGGGDDNATKATYIRLRVEQLRRAAVAASAVRITATQPNPVYSPAPTTAKPKPPGTKCLYDVLGITQDVSDAQILAGYQIQKEQLDARENKDAETKNRLIFIQHAKEVLLDPAKRAAYDARITAEAAKPENVRQEKSSGSSTTAACAPLSNRDLYAAYLGEKNQDYYLNKFEELDRQGDGLHMSWNWPAFFIALWPLYRKMYGWFFALLLFLVILSMLGKNMPVAVMVIDIATATAIGMFANVIYYRKVKKRIAAAQRESRDDNELIILLRKKGGVHSWVWWVLLAALIIGILAAIAIPAYDNYQKRTAASQSQSRNPSDKHDIQPAAPGALSAEAFLDEPTAHPDAMAAGWIRVSGTENQGDTFYADPASIRRDGNMVKMWSLFNSMTAIQNAGDRKPFVSSKRRDEFDCEKEQWRLLESADYSGSMAKGEVTYLRSYSDSQWHSVSPNSIAETMWKIACGKLRLK